MSSTGMTHQSKPNDPNHNRPVDADVHARTSKFSNVSSLDAGSALGFCSLYIFVLENFQSALF